MSPGEAMDISGSEVKTTVFVDLRNPVLYDKGHLNQVVNIPAGKFLDRYFMDMLRNFHEEDQTVVLYGQDQLDAIGPFMFLRQTGFPRLKILMGGYDYYIHAVASGNEVERPQGFVPKEPRFDFAGLIEEMGGAAGEIQQKVARPVIPERIEKTNIMQGGC